MAFCSMTIPLHETEYRGNGKERWRSEAVIDTVGVSMLSMLRFRMKPSMNIEDNSAPAGRLWNAVLDYLRTLPGCQEFYWSRTTESSDLVEIELLLPFESMAWWQNFQKSLGAGLAVGLFADVPSYRFMRLRSTNVFGHGRKMNMRTYRLCPSATGNQRDKFEEAWSKAETLLRESGYLSQGGWLEYEDPASSIPQDDIVFSINTFVALIAYPEDTPRSRATNRGGSHVAGQDSFSRSLARSQAIVIEITQESIPNVDDSLMGLTDQATLGVDSRTLYLKAEPGAQLPKSPDPPILAPESLASLIVRLPNRRSSYAEAADTMPSISETAKLLLRKPPGGHWPMGDIVSQYSRKSMGDVVLQYCPKFARQLSLTGSDFKVLDVAHMVFPLEVAEIFKLSKEDRLGRIGPSHPDIEPGFHPTVTAFKEWRRRFFDLRGSEALYWGVCDSHPDTVIALLYWSTEELRKANQQAFYESFSTLASTLTRPIQIFYLSHQPEHYRNPSSDYAELVFFRLAACENDRSLFEEYFLKFYAISYYSVPGIERIREISRSRTTGGKIYSPGAWIEKTETVRSQVIDSDSKPSLLRDEAAIDTYVGFFTWRTTEKSKEQWLHDFATGSYERVGWLADGLRCVTTKGAESFKVQFRKNTALRFESDARQGTVSSDLEIHPGGLL